MITFIHHIQCAKRLHYSDLGSVSVANVSNVMLAYTAP